MFENILVCLDGSKLAEQILPLAKAQAKQFNSRVILFQVVPSPARSIVQAGATYQDPKSIAEQEQVNLEKAINYLESISIALRAKGLNVETAAKNGAPVGKVILDYAKEHDINLIAIATHGHGGLGRLVFGSVAESVLRESGLPMLVIRPKNL